jgi:hypothetical protein
MKRTTRVSRRIGAGYLGALVGILLLADPAVHAQFGDSGAETYDGFGRVLAHGDFNNDGFQDLAVGVPSEDIGGGPGGAIGDAGAVEVIYGTASGLSAANRQFWRQGGAGVEDGPEISDQFGWSLAVGDFNGDGYDDLAIGVPLEGIGSIAQAGAVHVIHGSVTGLSTTAVPDQFWHQDSPGVLDTSEASDWFGWSLAAGDFNGDGRDDLAIGAQGESIGDMQYAGAVHVLRGTASGLSATSLPDQFWHQNSPGMADVADYNDRFGWSLTASDFNGDGYADLVIGVPFEGFVVTSTITVPQAGAVHVLYGSIVSLTTTAPPGSLAGQFWHQNKPGVDDAIESGDLFGYALVTGDFNNDGYRDLAIAVPYEDIGAVHYAGAVHMFLGSSGGLTATLGPFQFWHQDRPNVEDVPDYADTFGRSLAAGDFDGDGYDDLAIGAPNESAGSVSGAGAVNVLRGSSYGITNTVVQFWHQNVSNVEGTSAYGDLFGDSLAAGDFNGDGHADLAIGVPGEEVYGDSPITDAGAVNVLYGYGFGLSATGIPDQFWTQKLPLVFEP